MKIFDEYHQGGAKSLFGQEVIPDRLPVDGVADVRDALDFLFNHPNVGPFFGKFLIQRLVTSNPSPAYVERVARAFNGESSYGTERGDLKAVIKAILLDEEARSCLADNDTDYGMLREPFVRYVQLGKAFDNQTPNGQFRNALETVNSTIGQSPLTSPSVFNFFQSDYAPIGSIEQADRVAPEFQITSSQSIAGYLDGLYYWLIRDHYENAWHLYNGEPDIEDFRGSLDLSDEIILAEEERYEELLDRLNLILAHGKLTRITLDPILQLLNEAELENLIMSSPEYLINR